MRGHGPGRVGEWLVADAPARELVDVRSGRGRPDDLVSGVGERSELRSEQERQADVGGRDVHDPRARPHDSAPE